MKKFTKKLLIACVAVSSVVCMGVSLTACGGAKQVTLTGSYGSGSYSFMSAYPGFTFKQLTAKTQTLNTYDDNSYELTVTEKNLSGDLSFDASNSGDMSTTGTNDRGQVVTTYYGTYTSSVEEGMMSVVISKPTKVVRIASGNLTGGAGYYNSAAWTDAMGEKFQVDNVNGTAEQFLASLAFTQTTIVVDLSTYGFNYATLTVAK